MIYERSQEENGHNAITVSVGEWVSELQPWAARKGAANSFSKLKHSRLWKERMRTTERELLPLFDWNADPLRAEQCWHGYLWWGRWLPGLTERLLPQFDETLNRLAKLPNDLRRQAISHVGGLDRYLALFHFENPVASGWLTKTVAKLPQSDLDRLTSEIGRLLDDTAPTVAEKIWDRWLKDYWEMRLLGKPKPLSRKEATEMVYWSLSLGQRLPDALLFRVRLWEETEITLRAEMVRKFPL